ncbi:uncharacterized protein LOC110024569 [Phalaenopsis equestris]|uniref:uncharacterized protein LOC110024569 n=1 Tax=Phalaenopsis equestris TaxID=78828 RepID=UPI0009E631CE|nr:uncharacterized protein LOC110024569 [Phalaenopsis equestris]
MVETETCLKLKCLRSANGGEYIDGGFKEYCAAQGIIIEKTTLGTPQQNGIGGKIIRSRNVIFNENVMYKDKSSIVSETTLKESEFVRFDDLLEITVHDRDACDDESESGASTPIVPQSVLEQPLQLQFAELPSGKNALHNKWLYRVKPEHDDNKRYKARLVVKGFQQKQNIDYSKIFSLVVKLTTIIMLLSMVATEDRFLEQLDVKTTFLHGDLEEDINLKGSWYNVLHTDVGEKSESTCTPACFAPSNFLGTSPLQLGNKMFQCSTLSAARLPYIFAPGELPGNQRATKPDKHRSRDANQIETQRAVKMSGSFLRSGGLRSARELLLRTRFPVSSGLVRESAQRPRAYVNSFPAGSKVGRNSSSHLSPAAYSALSSAASRNGFVCWYLGMIEARPILTKSITSGVIFIAADITSQMVTLSASASLDWIRTLRMASYGTLVAGPALHLWFNFASRIIPERDVISTLKKIFIGQTCFGPIMTSIFFSLNAGLQGESASEILARLRRDLIPTLLNGLLYWPICDFVTFRFVPVRLQPLVSNSFSFVWTIYLTYMASLQKVSAPQIAAN